MGVPLCCIISVDYVSKHLIDNRIGCRLKQIIVVIEYIERKEIMALKFFFTCKRKLNLKTSECAFRHLHILFLCRTTQASQIFFTN